ncbi:MAG TPA: hypothetical protein VF206_00015 [Rubrobacter sp.]
MVRTETTPPGRARTEGQDHGPRILQVHEHPVAQHRVEGLPAEHLARPLPLALDEPGSLANVFVLRGEPPARLREHLFGGVEDGYLVAFAEERDRLLARAAPHVDDAGRRPGKVFDEPAVDELVAYDPAQGPARRVVARGEVGEGVVHRVATSHPLGTSRTRPGGGS